MFCKEKVAVFSDIHTQYINALCGQDVEFFIVKPGCT